MRITKGAGLPWLMPVILATQEADIRKLEASPQQISPKTLSPKDITKKELVEWLKWYSHWRGPGFKLQYY
jgi:hypothetical protein